MAPSDAKNLPKKREKAKEKKSKDDSADESDMAEQSGWKIGRFRINLSRLPELLLLFALAGMLSLTSVR